MDQEHDGIYEEGVNQWDNIYSNEYSLMLLDNGGTAGVNECRRIGYKAPSSYVSAFYGTQGAYQFNNAQHLLTQKTKEGVQLTDVSNLINPIEMMVHKDEADFRENVANHMWQWNCFSPQQQEEIKRLPESYRELENGHMASHQFLIDDFCSAAYQGKQPVIKRLEGRPDIQFPD